MRILLIEDDETLCQSLAFHFRQNQMELHFRHNAHDGYSEALHGKYSLIILDRMLPDMDGLQLLTELRASHILIPILLLTALGSLEDKVSGLESGADDYMVKPFAFPELLARVHTLIRRSSFAAPAGVRRFGDIEYSYQTRTISCGPKRIQLSRKEADLFELLLQSGGETILRDDIITKVWGSFTEIENGNLDNYIYFLRKRLTSVQSSTRIKTIRGIGFRLTPPQKEST